MNLVKEYKGVKIFVSFEGKFYCDANTNSNDYKKKTFVSTKLLSIEKAIDNFKGQRICGDEYYDITLHNETLKPLQVISRVGDRLFFDDGTDTSDFIRISLYPKSIDSKPEFQDLKLIFSQIKENQKEINKLYENQKQLRLEAEKKIVTFKKVKFS